MASIDYQEARKEIEKFFKEKNFGGRKILFWYDPPMNFKEDILNDSLDFCRLLVCDKNEFEIKKIIEHDDTLSDILVYIPSEKPRDVDNWLLDILTYSEEYYADTVALTMRRLGLSNTDLRKIIEKHSKFFDAEARNKKLNNYVTVSDDMRGEELILAMMAVLVKASHRTIESILTELVFDDTEQTKYKEIKKYGFEENLWDAICNAYNYDGAQKIDVLIKRFMFTALLNQKAEFEDMPSFYQQFVIDGIGKMDANIFIDHIKNDKRYESLQLTLALDMKIEALISARDISCVQEADIFECIDNYIIKKIADSLRNGSLDYDVFERIIASRINSMWYDNHANEYDMLRAAISFFRQVDRPIIVGLSAVDYIKAYTENYYRVDFDYRHCATNYRYIDAPIIELEAVMDRVELFYQDKFLAVLGKEFSEALAKQGDWEFVGVESTKNFYNSLQRIQYKKMFVIISDAMRYEIGREIADVIKADPMLKGGAELSYSISPLPSETRFGMASLLPHREMQYSNKAVLVDGKMTNGVAARNAILQDKNETYSAIGYEEIVNFSRDELRAYMSDKTLVYIYHDTIDNAGEHNESKVFDVVEKAMDEILLLVKKLYNNLQISNFFITADHGFLYRRNTIQEEQKYSNIVSLKPTEASKRYILTDDDSISIPYTTEFRLKDVSDGQYRVITPYGYDLFKTQGSGLQYVHGGSSLQEIIVPVVHISELRSNKQKENIRPVGVRLKSITRKITNRSFSLDFEQYEKVEDKKQALGCETYFIDEDGLVVSNVCKFVANSTSDDAATRVTRIRFTLKNVEFDRNKRYFLILKNADRQDEFIEREQFTIDILSFKIF